METVCIMKFNKLGNLQTDFLCSAFVLLRVISWIVFSQELANDPRNHTKQHEELVSMKRA